MFPTPSLFLKAIGRKPNIPLSAAAGAQVSPEEIQYINRECLTPDYADRELAESDVSDLVNAFQIDEQTCTHIKEMHRRFMASTGSGSWPQGNLCHPSLYSFVGYHATTVWIDYADFMKNNSLNREVSDQEWQSVIVDAKVWPSLSSPVTSIADAKNRFVYKDQTRAKRAGKDLGDTFNCLDMGIWLASEATRRAGIFLIEVFTGSNGKHNIHVRTYAMPGSLSGLGYFPDGTCGDHVTCNIDSLNNYGLGRFTGLLTHELGHCIDLRHEFASPQSRHRSIMSYAQDNSPFQGYRKSGSPYQYVEDHSWPELRRFFGGEPAKGLDGDDIGPGTEKIIIDPVLWDEVNGDPVIRSDIIFKGREFIIVPKPYPGG